MASTTLDFQRLPNTNVIFTKKYTEQWNLLRITIQLQLYIHDTTVLSNYSYLFPLLACSSRRMSIEPPMPSAYPYFRHILMSSSDIFVFLATSLTLSSYSILGLPQGLLPSHWCQIFSWDIFPHSCWSTVQIIGVCRVFCYFH